MKSTGEVMVAVSIGIEVTRELTSPTLDSELDGFGSDEYSKYLLPTRGGNRTTFKLS